MPYKDVADHRRVDALSHRKASEKARSEIIGLLGGKCIPCGFSDPRALAIDHIDGGGTAEHKAKGGSYYNFILQRIKNGSVEYQLLCFNCNEIKKREKREQRNQKYAG